MSKPLLMVFLLASAFSLNVNHELAVSPSTDDLLDHDIVDHEEEEILMSH